MLLTDFARASINGCVKAHLAIVVILTCGGCATRPVASYLPARSFTPDIALTARAEGRLTVRDGCIRIGDALVIWPLGSRLVKEGGRQYVVTSDERRYGIGSYVSLGGGGGAAPPTGLAAPLPPECDGPFFSAN